MADAPGGPADDDWAALVPELLVTDLSRSLEFRVGTDSFALRFTRPEHGVRQSDPRARAGDAGTGVG